MSEQNTTEETDTQQADDSQEETEVTTFDADYVEKLRRENAKYRTEAKANAEAAARLAEIEEANKTEAEKTAERLAQAEKAAEEARSEALRFKIAAKFQVSDEDADLFLTAGDEETLTKQAQRLVERAEQQRKTGLHVPREGGNGGGNSSTADLFAAAIKDQL